MPMTIYQLPLCLYDSTARAMERLVARIALDDALVRQGWRLERVCLERGWEHFRLYKVCGKTLVLVGVVDVTTPAKLGSIHKALGIYLAGLGFTPRNTRHCVWGSRTPIDAGKYGVGQLFKVEVMRVQEAA